MKKWTLLHKGNIEESEKKSVSKEVYQILKNRGITDDEDIEIFTNPSLEYLRDPFIMKDMKKAVNRIEKAVENRERIWIYGDYDVDGVSSTSIFIIYFRSIGYDVRYYIPNRLEEGYGINKEAIDYIESEGADLIISVDCGITSVEEAKYCREKNIDLIITDHHECQSEIPDAYAVINPKQEDCYYPFDMLCGCGVAFKIIQALTPPEIFRDTVYDYIEIATMATICDVVPLVDENRIIVKNGLKSIKNCRNVGLDALIDVCGVDKEKIGSSHIGFSIGPRINASGRLGFSGLGVELFTETDREKAIKKAMQLDAKNDERQIIESKIYHDAEEEIKRNPSYLDDRVLVIAHEGWQHGVIGIVASKLTEKYYKPTILLCIEDGEATGSARSIKGFSIFDALMDSSELLNKFGGHEQAAGLSLSVENIDELRKKINSFADYNLSEEDMIEEIKAEFEICEESANFKLIEELHMLEPFGVSNPTPRFMLRDCLVNEIRYMGKNRQHIKIIIEKNNRFECIGFNAAHLADGITIDDRVDIIFQLDENTYMGNRKVQFIIKDIRLAYPSSVSSNIEAVNLMMNIIPKDNKNLYINRNYDIRISKEDVSGNIEENILSLFNKNTLVMANTINGYFRAKSDISIINEDYSVYFNCLNTEKTEDEIHLIFAPNIDKIDIKRYNNIILYDYLYNEGDYADLYSKKSEKCRIIKNYSELDLVYLKNIIDNIVPDRDEFVVVYRYVYKMKSLSIRLDDIKAVFRMTPLKVIAALRVFAELGLVDFEMSCDSKFIKAVSRPKPDTKLDLNKSEILTNLKMLRRDSYEFYKF